MTSQFNWRTLYFGKVSPQEVQEAVSDSECQKTRISMKGKSLEAKYDILQTYYLTTFGKS